MPPACSSWAPDEGGRGGQDPGAEAAPVAEVVNVAERAHGAEIGGEHHGAEQAADRQPSQRQPDAAVLGNPIAQRFDHRGSSPTAILSHKRQAICSAACRLPVRTFKGLGVASGGALRPRHDRLQFAMTEPIRTNPAKAAPAPLVRAPEGAFGLLAAGRRHHQLQAGQAGGGAGLPCGGAHGHQQSVRRTGVLRQACRCRHPADRRLHAAGRLRRSPAAKRTAAQRRQPAALAAGRRARALRLRRAGLAESHEARPRKRSSIPPRTRRRTSRSSGSRPTAPA